MRQARRHEYGRAAVPARPPSTCARRGSSRSPSRAGPVSTRTGSTRSGSPSVRCAPAPSGAAATAASGRAHDRRGRRRRAAARDRRHRLARTRRRGTTSTSPWRSSAACRTTWTSVTVPGGRGRPRPAQLGPLARTERPATPQVPRLAALTSRPRSCPRDRLPGSAVTHRSPTGPPTARRCLVPPVTFRERRRSRRVQVGRPGPESTRSQRPPLWWRPSRSVDCAGVRCPPERPAGFTADVPPARLRLPRGVVGVPRRGLAHVEEDGCQGSPVPQKARR